MKQEIKTTNFLVEIVEGCEFESVIVRGNGGRILFAGTKAGFLEWFETCTTSNESESKSNN